MIDIQSEVVRVICTGGDHMLGGKLWDDRVIEYIAAEFARQTGNTEDILSDPETLQELALSSERAKKMLSAREKAPIGINFRGERARVELTRDQFDALTADLLERTVLLTHQMLEEAAQKGYKPSDIGEILLVGGSSRMPQIMQRIKEEFSAPVKIYDPDESVAKGAALYANRQAFFNEVLELTAQKTGKTTQQIRDDVARGKADIKKLAKEVEVSSETPQVIADMDIINVTSRSFGTIAFQDANVEEPQEVLYNMILKNTELPVIETRRFFTVAENQETVKIKVLESLSTERHAGPEEGTEIGETVLELPEGLPVASPLEIEFRLNESGLLELRATELAQNRDVVARFETTDVISPSEKRGAAQRLEESMVY
jgi:molecular chaperone DnaK (HSP70)